MSMNASILGLGTAVPENILWQHKFATLMEEFLAADSLVGAKLQQLQAHTAIEKRHLAQADFLHPRQQWHFWGERYPQEVPTTSTRNKAFQKLAPQLACKAAAEAIDAWGGDPKAITHVISVSCTGLYAPGLEFDVQHHLGLKPTTCRLGINFMGCYGAFKGLAVAKSFALENPRNRILVVCTELCSLHLQIKKDLETLTGNAIFADGASAIIVGGSALKTETPLWDIVDNGSYSFENTKDKITWEPGDQGFVMRLSAHVPVLLKKHSLPFVQSILKDNVDKDACDFAIHPGGKSILQAMEKSISLSPDQTFASWETLANYGNMSSATFLFVLQHLMRQHTPKPWTLGLGFGPGLGIEGILLRKHHSIQSQQ
jgi:predicted naringenin-chalcone synthase